MSIVNTSAGKLRALQPEHELLKLHDQNGNVIIPEVVKHYLPNVCAGTEATIRALQLHTNALIAAVLEAEMPVASAVAAA